MPGDVDVADGAVGLEDGRHVVLVHVERDVVNLNGRRSTFGKVGQCWSTADSLLGLASGHYR